jgi:hypothetical protein
MIYQGELSEVRKTPKASTEFQPGDLVMEVPGATTTCQPASRYAYVSGGLAATQAAFVTYFLGECLDLRLSTDTRTEKVNLATSGRSVKTIASAGPYVIGQLFGPDGTGSVLMSQQLVAVSSITEATHVLVEDVPASSTSVKVALLNTLSFGG